MHSPFSLSSSHHPPNATYVSSTSPPVLDALPSFGQVPKTIHSTIQVVSDRMQKSNIVPVSVYTGLSTSDTIAPLLTQFEDGINPHSVSFFI
ncbi:hypothetical protein DFJ58DRAFT_411442 [Suillus subalutaceus]|uniref:uncharacterized protein n=1 Tax=Suillus subalutaceus TaxID=48586 RepID=UPI001B872077|nr:uncharacterized protein DFJ58DRAFT_411442 [Suillus subalutaceus]KAG1852434.1 hypothetical protein DFJ58DRAFT_411442 [Suillus subalutaceus]